MYNIRFEKLYVCKLMIRLRIRDVYQRCYVQIWSYYLSLKHLMWSWAGLTISVDSCIWNLTNMGEKKLKLNLKDKEKNKNQTCSWEATVGFVLRVKTLLRFCVLGCFAMYVYIVKWTNLDSLVLWIRSVLTYHGFNFIKYT